MAPSIKYSAGLLEGRGGRNEGEEIVENDFGARPLEGEEWQEEGKGRQEEGREGKGRMNKKRKALENDAVREAHKYDLQ